MFTLDATNIKTFDLKNAGRFVESWSEYDNGNTTIFDPAQINGGRGNAPNIDYFSELNIGSDLTEENIRRLLRWKDRIRLTQTKLSGLNKGKSNPKVDRVLQDVNKINQFRSDQIGEAEMRSVTAQIFPNGDVWQFFLLHIAKPHVYPIGDVNVFTACSVHTGRALNKPYSWEDYQHYRAYFGEIAEVTTVPLALEYIRALKKIDDALVAFGQFLLKYCPDLVQRKERGYQRHIARYAPLLARLRWI